MSKRKSRAFSRERCLLASVAEGEGGGMTTLTHESTRARIESCEPVVSVSSSCGWYCT